MVIVSLRAERYRIGEGERELYFPTYRCVVEHQWCAELALMLVLPANLSALGVCGVSRLKNMFVAEAIFLFYRFPLLGGVSTSPATP